MQPGPKSSRTLTAGEFRRFLCRDFVPSQFDRFNPDNPENARFPPGVGHHHLCESRCYRVYREVAEHVGDRGRLLDIGFYPGILVRVLKALLGDRIECHGAGNQITPEFERFARTFLASSQAVDFAVFAKG